METNKVFIFIDQKSQFSPEKIGTWTLLQFTLLLVLAMTSPSTYPLLSLQVSAQNTSLNQALILNSVGWIFQQDTLQGQ
jgi:hypothetical protein